MKGHLYIYLHSGRKMPMNYSDSNKIGYEEVRVAWGSQQNQWKTCQEKGFSMSHRPTSAECSYKGLDIGQDASVQSNGVGPFGIQMPVTLKRHRWCTTSFLTDLQKQAQLERLCTASCSCCTCACSLGLCTWPEAPRSNLEPGLSQQGREQMDRRLKKHIHMGTSQQTGIWQKKKQ